MTKQEIQSIKQRFGIVGQSPLLERGIEIAMQVAPTDLSVLITGESGVGKEHFPQIIHANSLRKHNPYFAINCGAIPEGTIDSELFGHEKGAYTDAHSERKGYFEIANGGTLFLDEVGELPLATQAKLLRVLETGEFIRLGSSKVLKSNVRVVAATNVDIKQAIQNGRFREDLYYRINTVEIKVPPLRERKDDIPILFRKFAQDCSIKYHMPAVRLNDDATQMLKNYYWNGNVRQLKNVVEQLSVIETNHDIGEDVLKKYLPQNEIEGGIRIVGKNSENDMYLNEREMLFKLLFEMKRDINILKQQLSQKDWPSNMGTPTSINETDPNDFQMVEEVKDDPQSMEDVERENIKKALQRSNGRRHEAAIILGVSDRTLYRKIKEYGL